MMFYTTFTFVFDVYSRLKKVWIKDQILHKFVQTTNLTDEPIIVEILPNGFLQFLCY